MSNPFDDLEKSNSKSITTANGGSGMKWVVIAGAIILTLISVYVGLGKKESTPDAPGTQNKSQAPQVQPQSTLQQPALVTAEQDVAVAKAAVMQQATQIPEVKTGGITICSGPAKGAFEKVVADINGLGLGMVVKPTTGAGDNLTFIHDGQCQYGLINSDDYWSRLNAGNDPRIKNTRVVMGLFEGVVHMAAIDSQLTKFSQSEGKRVGVTGGAVATFSGMVIPKTGMNFDVVAYNSTKDLLTALSKGQVDMIVMVGAKPQPWLKEANVPGLHLVEFDRFEKMGDLMTGSKNGFLAKRPVGPADYPNLGDKPVVQLTTRTVLATTTDANKDPEVAVKTKEIFRQLSNGVSGLRSTGHDSWKTVTTMNDPGGLPWATIR